MKTFVIALTALIMASPTAIMARRALTPRTDAVATLNDSTACGDTANVSHILPAFDENAVTMRGFNKRVADNYETFFVQNNTQLHITAITVTMRYTSTDGTLLHERTIGIPCDVMPGTSRQVSVDSFDSQHMFYYYLSGKPRKSATPFNVSVRLMGYDVAIRRP